MFSAASAEEALKIFKKNKDIIKLVITDMNMPGKSGADLGAVIREISPSIPIILCASDTETQFVFTKKFSKGWEVLALIDYVTKYVTNISESSDVVKDKGEGFKSRSKKVISNQKIKRPFQRRQEIKPGAKETKISQPMKS